MKSLHLLANSSSMLAVTVRSLRELGFEAHGLIYARNWAQSNESDGCEVIVEADRKQKIERLRRKVRTALRAARLVRDVDVVHWYNALAAEGPLDLWLAQRIGRKGVVEFVGGDVRNFQLASADNPYYKEVWDSGKYEYSEETPEHSEKVQRSFLKYGVRSVFAHETLKPFLLADEWKVQLPCRWRLDVDRFVPKFSEKTSEPLIVHMTTAPHCKGTFQVEAILDSLRGKVNFRYERIEGKTREQALNLLCEADIYLDQFVLAEGLGVAALEAMALGKPVVSYVKPSLEYCWPPHVVNFVNAPFEQLAEKVQWLIEDHESRRRLGMASRDYVERFHNGKIVAKLIAEGYEQVLPMSR
jgi:glycosyltransferase involved in cell wall biosynthesis